MIGLWVFVVIVSCILVGAVYLVWERLSDIADCLLALQSRFDSDDPDPDDGEPIVEHAKTNVVAFKKVNRL